MRFTSLLAVVLMLFAAGCTRQITGVAQPDPRGPGTTLSSDGFGIVVGDPGAPIQIELFTEPQCNHCADLQRDFGDELSRYLNLGQLVITYRPLTFLDTEPGGHSARVGNALFLAAGHDTSATAFQAFVQDLWAHQDPGGAGPTDDEIADLATESGLPAPVVDTIKAGKSGVDVTEMGAVNFEYLYETDPQRAGTPTVYDVRSDEILDIYDDDWLDKLMSS